MRITKIHTRGMKGKDIDLDLGDSGRHVLTGRNGSGKTTALQCVEYAASGSVTGVGKRGQDLATLASGSTMTAEVSVEGGLRVTRDLIVDGAATRTNLSVNPSRGEKGVRAVEKRLASTLGVTAGIVDAGALLDATPGKRAEMILAMAAAAHDDACSAETFFAEIDHANVPQKVAQGVRAAWSEHQPLMDNLGAVRKVAAEWVSETENELRRAKQGAERLRSDMGAPLNSRSGDIVAGERAEAGEKLSHVERELAAAESRNQAAVAVARRIKDAEDAVSRAAEAIKQAQTAEESSAAAQVTAEKALASAQEAPGPTEPDAWDEDRDTNLAAAQKATSEAQSVKAKLQAEYEALEASLRTLSGKDACPTCRQEVSADFVTTIAELKDASKQAYLEANEEWTRLRDHGNATWKQRNEAWDAHKAATKDHEDAVRKHAEAIRDAEIELRAAKRMYDTRAARVIEARGEFAAAQKRAAEVNAETGDAPGAVSDVGLQALNSQKVTLTAKIDELDTEMRTMAQRVAIAKKLDEAEADMARLDGEVAVVRRFRAAVNAQVSNITARMLDPFEERVSGLLGRVRPTWRLSLRPQGSGVVIAVSTDGGDSWRDWSSLSGGESVVFTVALALAVVLIQDSPARWLLLEGAELDTDTMSAMLEALDEMGGDFHTILVAHHSAPEVLPGTWERIHVEEPARVA